MALIGLAERFETALAEAVALWQAGEYSAALTIVEDLLAAHATLTAVQIVRASILKGLIERDEQRLDEALFTYRNVAPLVHLCGDLVKGKYHNALAILHRRLNNYGQAFQEYTAASIHYELANEPRMRWDVENNLSIVLVHMGKPTIAYEHLDLARQTCDDPVLLAQINDTYAQAKLTEGKETSSIDLLMEALDYSMASVAYLRNAGEWKLLETSTRTLRLVCEQIEAHREGERIREALERAGGKVSRAAKILGIHHSTLAEKLKFKKYERVKDDRKPERRRSMIAVKQ